MDIVTVYVPGQDAGHPAVRNIAQGSAIVGEIVETGDVLVHFEGNLHGAGGLERYANRVRLAWSRASREYPTRARAIVPPDELVPVGEYDSREQVVRLTGDDGKRLLADWLGVADVEADQLIARN
jgi:hypothetical protein